MAAFAAACSGRGEVFLADPAWRRTERQGLATGADAGPPGEDGWLMIPSGGSSGCVKFARHDARTLSAAVRGFQAHFGLGRVNAVGVLPLCHVSGLMAWLRCALTEGRYIPWAWQDLQEGRFPEGVPDDCCLSLVPTQLQRLLSRPQAADWLGRFRIVFLGGAPAGAALLDRAAELGIRLSTGYGATETAAMAAALLPEEFLGGARGAGAALPHARITVDGGIISVSGESIHRGYHPARSESRTWVSGDLGAIVPRGGLQVIGRADDMIVTGGKKVSPAEVEEALLSGGAFADVAVLGLPDEAWGQSVVACHPAGAPPDKSKVEAALLGLASFKHPKRYLAISPWPRNAQGKIERPELRRLALSVSP
jgi:O-succinylbenzoic acid--CoA ligase